MVVLAADHLVVVVASCLLLRVTSSSQLVVVLTLFQPLRLQLLEQVGVGGNHVVRVLLRHHPAALLLRKELDQQLLVPVAEQTLHVTKALLDSIIGGEDEVVVETQLA